MSRSELLSLGRSTYGVNENSWVSAAMTGTVAAGAVALADVFWLCRTPTAAAGKTPMVIERIRVRFTCLTAFTTPVTANRALGLCILPALPALVGTAPLANNFRKQNLFGGGATDAQVAACNTTPFNAAASPPAITDVFGVMSLAAFGTSGASLEKTWEFNTGSAVMANVIPGQIIALVSPFGMDAAGTFQLAVECDLQALPLGYPVSP
jgi:hypothetical protein